MNTLSTKENGLLNDLAGQEKLCIDKYNKYSAEAKSPVLKSLFETMAKTEQEHLKTVNDMLSGNTPSMPTTIGNSNNQNTQAFSYANDDDKKQDAFFCTDMLTTEKHASSLYDTSVFEFTVPEHRRILNHIQAEEQQHGEQIYAYMKNNNMYN